MPDDATDISPDDSFASDIASALNTRRSRHQFRHRQILRPIDSVHCEIDGKRYINFCSNNYLGLTHHPRVIAAVQQATQTHGVGAAASPLICGYSELHNSAERALATWKGTQGAVLLPSGYQANHAAVQAIAGVADAQKTRVRFLLDKLAHASLIDAVRGSSAPFRVFPHNDMTKLGRLLDSADDQERQVVVTESIFSMDGDSAPLRGFADLKRAYSFTLLLDEAHGSGVYGNRGSGYASEAGLTEMVDIFVITLSKSLGCAGGAICASSAFCEAAVNFGRAYVFSTSIPPSSAAACEAAIGVMRDEPHRQQRVRILARRVRDQLAGAGMTLPPGDSPIVPVILGDEEATIAAANHLRQRGMLVLPVRPPTVPRGTSRLRVTLSCNHSDEEVDQLVSALRAITPTR